MDSVATCHSRNATARLTAAYLACRDHWTEMEVVDERMDWADHWHPQIIVRMLMEMEVVEQDH
jgi:hypothetical protein